MVRDATDDEIRRSRALLENPYAYDDGAGHYSAIVREQTVHDARRLLENQGGYSARPGSVAPRRPIHLDPDKLLGGLHRGDKFSRQDIEAIVRGLQAALWQRRQELWPARKEIGPIEVLDPILALEVIGYPVTVADGLGQHSSGTEFFEIAGMIEKTPARRVQLSHRFSRDIRNFTAAHELGHAILHAGESLHRDRPRDGGASGNRDATEREADLFASYFLLPEKQVRSEFKRTFLADRFVPDDANALALRYTNVDVLRADCTTLRELARVLAGATYYNGAPCHSLSERFGVSMEAMAIRLEELDLVRL